MNEEWRERLGRIVEDVRNDRDQTHPVIGSFADIERYDRETSCLIAEAVAAEVAGRCVAICSQLSVKDGMSVADDVAKYAATLACEECAAEIGKEFGIAPGGTRTHDDTGLEWCRAAITL